MNAKSKKYKFQSNKGTRRKNCRFVYCRAKYLSSFFYSLLCASKKEYATWKYIRDGRNEEGSETDGIYEIK